MSVQKPSFEQVLTRFKELHNAKEACDLEKDLAPPIEGAYVGSDGVLSLVEPTVNRMSMITFDDMDSKPQTVESDTRTNPSLDEYHVLDFSAEGKTHSIQEKYIDQIEELTERAIDVKEHVRMNTEYDDFPVLIDVPNSEMRFVVSPVIV